MKRNLLVTILLLSAVLAGCGNSAKNEAEVENNTVVGAAPVGIADLEDMEIEDTEIENTEAVEDNGITKMSAIKYAKSEVNVRSGASSDYDAIGSLRVNEEVTVTGQADSGWYRIDYNGSEGYVSDKYLVDEKVAVNTGSNDGNGNAASVNTNANTGSGNTGTTNKEPSAGTGNTTNSNTGSSANTGNSGVAANPTPTPDAGNSGTATTPSTGSNSSGLTPDQQEMVDRNEALDKSTADLLEGVEIIGGLGTQQPTTDGYGDGTTITIKPVP